jgi:radical SAM superfamily enzyme YgiQ (UPF0313 family)
MKQSGCTHIHLGIENGNDRILKSMNKQLDIETIKKSVQAIKDANLRVTASFMIGFPDEREEEILQTIQFSKDLELNSSQFFYVAPEPRTEMYQDLKVIKQLPDDIYSDFTLNPDSVDLKENIASTVFTKKDLEDFVKFAYTQTNNLYRIKESKC